jgi:hypothetical protein
MIVLAVALTATTGVASAKGLIAGLPAGAAGAALRPAPTLPKPTGWSFPDAFSPTSGTGRLTDGALEWTDWVYDDYGASSPLGLPLNEITLTNPFAPAQGDYVYPAGRADNDGADIFTAAVGLTRTATVWRVDWNTLVNPDVPIAEWTFDTDNDPASGASRWPAGANVTTPGIKLALVVSAKGAELINAVTGKTVAKFKTQVDMASHTFLVRVPRSTMPVSKTWRIQLAAGLANASGTGFAAPTLTGGIPAPSTDSRIYNITFRTAAQEPPVYLGGQSDSLESALYVLLGESPVVGAIGGAGAAALVTGNFWSEDDQANALASGNVSKFSELVKWSALAAHDTTPVPLVHGYSDRWYVSNLKLGHGVDDAVDANPAYLARIQPYAVYVPSNYTGRVALPLTWILHSLDVNYNQYGALDPRLLQEECQDRGSICAMPEGFGADGDWSGDAEHDFWQVWRSMASGFRLNPTRTVISGYSMGGIGSYLIGLTYPSDFSEAMPLDGLDDSDCAKTNRTTNAEWEPFVISNAAADEESPWTDADDEASDFQAASQRYEFFTTTLPEHNVTAVADGFSTQVNALHGTPQITADPGTVHYTWCSAVVNKALGLGPTSVYWLSGLSQRSLGASSSIVADDQAIPAAAHSENREIGVVNPSDAPPMAVIAGTWKLGAVPRAQDHLSLRLTNVGGLTLDAAAAKLKTGTAIVTSDGATVLRLADLAAGTRVDVDGNRLITAGRNGTAVVRLSNGVSALSW